MGPVMARPASTPPQRPIDSIRPCGSRGHRLASRGVVSGIALIALAFAAVSAATRAHAAGAADAAPTSLLLSQGVAEQPLDLRWRARGVAFVDLPFGLRARYEAQALHRLAERDGLSPAFFDLPTGGAAAPRRARLLESRFALSCVLAQHLELELSWAARSPLSMVDLLWIEDQRVAAMIRFVP